VLAKIVIMATGGLGNPLPIPNIDENPRIHRFIVNDVIQDPASWSSKTILVVGGGDSGADAVRAFSGSNRVIWVTRKSWRDLYKKLLFRQDHLGVASDFLQDVDQVITDSVLHTIDDNVAHFYDVLDSPPSLFNLTFDACFLMLGYERDIAFLHSSLGVTNLSVSEESEFLELAWKPGIFLIGTVRGEVRFMLCKWIFTLHVFYFTRLLTGGACGVECVYMYIHVHICVCGHTCF